MENVNRTSLTRAVVAATDDGGASTGPDNKGQGRAGVYQQRGTRIIVAGFGSIWRANVGKWYASPPQTQPSPRAIDVASSKEDNILETILLFCIVHVAKIPSLDNIVMHTAAVPDDNIQCLSNFSCRYDIV